MEKDAPKVRLYFVLQLLLSAPFFHLLRLDGNETINCMSIAFATADGTREYRGECNGLISMCLLYCTYNNSTALQLYNCTISKSNQTQDY